MHLINEKYHIYNRGAHKELVFHDENDYKRFISLLFVCNDEKPLKRLWWISENIFDVDGRKTLTKVLAYCLMPNHFHIALEEVVEHGIERYVHKLCTSYTMYYNRKYKHSGTIFQGNYKWKIVSTDDYLRYLIEYIHLNPFGIEEPDLMKTAKPEYLAKALKVSAKYNYSSFKDYLGVERPQGKILNFGG